MLPALHKPLQHQSVDIRKESCWLISNIAADTDKQIQQLIDMDISPGIIWILDSDDYILRKEAAWAVSNATSGGVNAQKIFLANLGVLPSLFSLLRYCRENYPQSDLRSANCDYKFGKCLKSVGSCLD